MFSFPKEQRLRQRETIANLSAKGSPLFKFPLKAYWMPGGAEVSRYAVAVPKKSFKRRIREAIRLNQAECLGGFCGDYLFVYIAKDICEFPVVEAAVKEILTKSRQQ